MIARFGECDNSGSEGSALNIREAGHHCRREHGRRQLAYESMVGTRLPGGNSGGGAALRGARLSEVRPGWMVANGLGGAAGAVLFDPLHTAVSIALGESHGFPMVYLAGGILFGIGAGQGIVLRRIPWARSLVLAEMWGTALGMAAGVTASAMLRGAADAGTAVAMVVSIGWGVFAATQWVVLRGRGPWTAKWVLVSGSGLAAALLVAGLFTYLFAHALGGVLAAQLGHVGIAIFRAMQGLALGVVYGGITGRVRGGPWAPNVRAAGSPYPPSPHTEQL